MFPKLLLKDEKFQKLFSSENYYVGAKVAEATIEITGVLNTGTLGHKCSFTFALSNGIIKEITKYYIGL